MVAKQSKAEAISSGRGAIFRVFKRVLKDKLALFAFVTLISLYLMVGSADFISPYSANWSNRSIANAPPTSIYLIDKSGALTAPYIFESKRTFNNETLSFSYAPILDKPYPIHFLTQGESYNILGIIPCNLHLFGVASPAQISLLGNDMNGRDLFSRLLFGGRISLTIGFLSLFIVIPLGMLYGGISGYVGGRIDNLMMRSAEILMSIPSLYLLITLAAIIPSNMSSTNRFAMVVIILAFIGWAGFSRVIRGMVLTIKEQEFVEAGRAIGMNHLRIIIKHILPQTASYVIVAITLSVPGYILAESGLSFLGLGIQQPDASWGNMLKEAQNIVNVIYHPWMLAPAVLIFIAVLSFNVVGDAVRDVLDPKSYTQN